MKNLSNFAFEALDEIVIDDASFDSAFEEFCNDLSDDDKEKAMSLKESFRHRVKNGLHKAGSAIKHHATNAKRKAHSVIHSMWHDDHIGSSP